MVEFRNMVNQPLLSGLLAEDILV